MSYLDLMLYLERGTRRIGERCLEVVVNYCTVIVVTMADRSLSDFEGGDLA